jgi:hypothetical protein
MVVATIGCKTNDSESKSPPKGAQPSESAALRTVDAFDGVEVRAAVDLTVTEGEPQVVTIDAPPDVLPNVTTSVQNRMLSIGCTGTKSEQCRSIRAHVTAAKFKKLIVKGSGDIHATGPLRGSLELSIKGSGNVDLPVDMTSLAVQITGSGSAKFEGKAAALTVEVKGSGDLSAATLEAEKVSVNVAGSGNVDLSAAAELSVSIAGSGNVTYAGTPTLNKQITGSGTLSAK